MTSIEKAARRIEVEILRLDTKVDDTAETKLIAMDGKRFVGSVGLRHVGLMAACFRQLFVEPLKRRRGIGRQLVEECCAVAFISGCDSIALHLAAANEKLNDCDS